ncbi:MAG: HAD-IA family hydrolase [Ruminococcus sp.]|nr:HAD-IA family hydrolase [Ruminococcus sp.]
MNKPKWIFFDIGSTLVDESAVYENRIKEITQGNNIDRNEFAAKVIERAQTSPKPIVSAAEDYGVKVPAWRHDLEALYPDTKEVLQRLSQKYKIGIIANQDFGTEQRLTDFNVHQYIDLVIASAEEGVAKPDLRIFQIALARADCKPEEAIMVGDRLDNDIVPANKIGMTTVWIKQGFGSYAEPKTVEEQPDYIVNSLAEITEVFR